MDDAKRRAWWWHKQALDGRLSSKSAGEVLAQTGWARSVGGVGPYLTLFSRAGISREAADAAAANLEIHELPSARGCTYVVPACDFALALKAGQGFSDEAEMKVARKLGVTDAEVDKLSAKVVAALAKGVLDTDQIRQAVGGAVRSLGEEGKKKGLTTTLPLALGFLQSAGEIRRVPVNGRLDQQRYCYALWKPSPLQKSKLTSDECCTDLARRFFKWIGPATAAEFQAFSGLGVKAAKDAMEPLKLAAAGDDSEALMFPEDRDAYRAFQVPKKPQYALVGSLDGLSLLRRDVSSLVAPEDRGHEMLASKESKAGGALVDLPSHGIFDRGRLIGLWLFDPAAESIAWSSFGVKDKALDRAVERTQEFVRSQLGVRARSAWTVRKAARQRSRRCGRLAGRDNFNAGAWQWQPEGCPTLAEQPGNSRTARQRSQRSLATPEM